YRTHVRVRYRSRSGEPRASRSTLEPCAYNTPRILHSRQTFPGRDWPGAPNSTTTHSPRPENDHDIAARRPARTVGSPVTQAVRRGPSGGRRPIRRDVTYAADVTETGATRRHRR